MKRLLFGQCEMKKTAASRNFKFKSRIASYKWDTFSSIPNSKAAKCGNIFAELLPL